MLDMQDLLILGSGMGLLTNLIVLGNFLLKGRNKRQKNINGGSPNEGVEPEDLGKLARVLEGRGGPHHRSPKAVQSASESTATALYPKA